MVGLEVTPTTWKSSISDCRLPVRSRSRLMSSSQIDTPAAESSARTSFATVIFLPCSARARLATDPGQTVACRRGYPLGRDAKLLVNLLVGGRGAEVVYSD